MKDLMVLQIAPILFFWFRATSFGCDRGTNPLDGNPSVGNEQLVIPPPDFLMPPLDSFCSRSRFTSSFAMAALMPGSTSK